MRNLPTTIIVAHGSPSDQDTLEAAVQKLTQRVQEHASGHNVVGATLAKTGSLEQALRESSTDEPVAVYPFFMSEGWFVKSELRRRVKVALDHLQLERAVSYHPAFGLDPKVPELCRVRALEAAERVGAMASETVLVMAAHGSQKGPAAAEAAEQIASAVRDSGTFGAVRVGFVEQAPTITEAASDLGGRVGICLPLFATTAGHVLMDIPEQLEAAGFGGDVLRPIGEDEEVPRLIASAIMSPVRTLATT
ncbi:MAG: CbiX/SirB N-terminal domain-containing protein [Filomicrobium sp.]